MSAGLDGYRLGYRSDVEGLRAVAILLVVAAHASVAGLAGGFIGVDVFFVLSGYLITGLLWQEIAASRRIAFAAFYARRIRRLLPGLLLMLLCTFALGVLLVSPIEQPGQAIAGATAAFWMSNFYFVFAQFDYFGPAADTNLFLHTWSLGVEEQFYLLWPALLVVLLKGSAGLAPDVGLRRLKIGMGLVLAMSLVGCVLLTPLEPLASFYLMPTRAWQFALGGLVFLQLDAPLRLQNQGSPSAGPAVRSFGVAARWCGWTGLALIAASALWLDTNVLYPGVRAVVPSLGAALILGAGAVSAGNLGVGRLLSLAPMQAIGRVSYAWYLWHWPVLLLGAAVVDVGSPFNRAGLVALSFGAAVLSSRLVEAPIRHSPRWIARPGYVVLSAVGVMIFTAALALRWHNAASDRIAGADLARFERARSEVPVIYGMGCDDWYLSAEVRVCAFGPESAPHTAVAMGDSIGLQWFPAMDKAFARPDWRLLVLTKSSCPMVDESFFYQRIGREYTECTKWRGDALAYVAALAPDVVILGSSSTYDFTQADWIEGTARVLRPLSESAQRVYLLRATPTLPFDGPGCLVPRSLLHEWLAEASVCAAPAYDSHAEDVRRWLAEAADRFPNVMLLDMNDAVCPQGRCEAERDGVVVFRDSQHLAAGFAGSLGGVLAAGVELE